MYLWYSMLVTIVDLPSNCCSPSLVLLVHSLVVQVPPDLTWMWVPYTCYYHMFSKADLLTCAASWGDTWIHTFGDSQEREIPSHLKLIARVSFRPGGTQVRDSDLDVMFVHDCVLWLV